jgi:cobalt-zinc-cadmium efflux system outer membrane protein
MRRSDRLFFASIVVTCLTPSFASGQGGETPLTLEAAFARAIAANRTLAAALLQRPVGIAAVDVARERLNPEVTYEAERETPRQAIGFAIPFELGGKRQRRIDLATAGITVREAEIERVRLEIRSRVRRSYFALVAANRRATLAADLRSLAVRARDAAQARFDAGDVPRLEVVQTELALVESENELAAAQGEVRAARAELNALFAEPLDRAYALTDDLSTGALPSLAQAQERAAASNTDVVVLDRRLAEQTARRDLARALRTPDLTAGASLTYHAEPEFSQGYRASLGVTVPLLTTHKAGVIFEEAELTRLKAERDATLADINGQVSAALARAEAAREQAARGETESLPRAAEVERMAQDAYSSGQTGLVALLQALQFTRDVRRRQLDASLAFQVALADLERAIGAPLP